MVDYINELGWDVYSFDHEGGDGQYEFDFGYTNSLAMADRMIVFRLMAKHVARSLGCIATFMPKPWSDAFGSGAHLNVSLADTASGRNLSKQPRMTARLESRVIPTLRIDSPRERSNIQVPSPPLRVRPQTPTTHGALRAHAGDVVGPGLPRLWTQQPHLDCKIADEPALSRSASGR